jgi:oligopeptide/dipeptide ABC transporter ATP-binding protein
VAFLEVKDLSLYYASPGGPVRAVDSVSFNLNRTGETLGIIGETGSGKSSLVMALARILPRNVDLYRGEVLFQDTELMALSNEQFRREVRWKKIAVVFQGAMNGFNPVLRVGRQLTERMLVEKIPFQQARREVEDILESVGLPKDIFNRYPHELSGGMKQRAAIAMALSLKPPLLILDEPTSALDVSVQAQIMNVLKRLKWDMGLSMLFITHDIALASDISDTIAVMYAGQIREYGSADEVLPDPVDPYTRELLASIPRLRGEEKPRFVSGMPPDPVSPPSGCRFRPRCPRAFDLCGQEPSLFEVSTDHYARCWLYDPSQALDEGKAHNPLRSGVPHEEQT